MRKSRIALIAAALSVIFSGCSSKRETPLILDLPTQPTRQIETTNYSWQAFPDTATKLSEALVFVEETTPKSVKANESFESTITITNNSGVTISNATLTQILPTNYTLEKADPKPDISGSQLTWNIKNLPSGSSKKITLNGKASYTGTLRYVGNSELSFASNVPTSTINAVRPDIAFTLSNPKVVVVGEEFPVDLTIRNPGTGILTNVNVIKQLPDGLLTAEGRSRLSVNIGDIDPGSSKSVTASMKTDKVGLYNTMLDASADDNLSASAKLELKATKPNILMTGNVPAKRFVGRVIPYRLSVKNNGDAPARDVTVTLQLPDGIEFASVNENGISSRAGQLATWTVPSILPNATATLNATAMPKRIMVVNATAIAEVTGQDSQRLTLITDVAGIPGLLGSLKDVNDPVPLGSDEVYILTVTNQGSLPATKVRVKCTLEDSMQFVKAEGATKGALYDKDSVIFEPLSVLDPQAEAKWIITVKAVKPGDVRFKVDITSDQLERPVELQESTHFYE